MKNEDNTFITARDKNRKIAVVGALGALTVVLGVTHLGLIPWFSGAAITVLHVPVILCVLLEGFVPGIIVGAIFGVFSLIQAIISPTGILDPFFRNPLVSVIPRILIAVVTYFVLKGLLFLTRKNEKFPKIIWHGVAAFFGSLANTVFVIGALFLLYSKEVSKLFEGKAFFAMLVALMPQALLEAGAAVIICVAVMGIVMGTKRKRARIFDE